ncbi:FIG00955061: hypothetical protein, partial [Pseudomonas fluorescens]
EQRKNERSPSGGVLSGIAGRSGRLQVGRRSGVFDCRQQDVRLAGTARRLTGLQGRQGPVSRPLRPPGHPPGAVSGAGAVDHHAPALPAGRRRIAGVVAALASVGGGQVAEENPGGIIAL